MRLGKTVLLAMAAAAPLQSAEEPADRFFIREYRVQGATVLPRAEVERTVYEFLGPERTTADIEQARASLEGLFHRHGYQTVAVEIPPQRIRRGVVVLAVLETTVGRLRVRDSHYHDIGRIKAGAPSMAEGQIPDFNAVMRDIVALNQWPHRRIVPELKPGNRPGTVDIDLRVEDDLPLHASIEVNNRHSPGTTELRLNASASYDNLWQAGHGVGASIQTSPLEWEEVLVSSVFYRARVAALPEWSFFLQGRRQDTRISTLGGAAVAGAGTFLGFRATRVLPGRANLNHQIGFGWERQRSDQEVDFGDTATLTPLTHYPLDFLYSAFWRGERSATVLISSLTLHFRGLGSDPAAWDASRYRADANFAILRAELAHTRRLESGGEALLRLQGQAASGPLISSHQFASGGLDSVRGYLEGEALGDQALLATLEFRSPEIPLPGDHGRATVFLFAEGGGVQLRQPLPGQARDNSLASFGAGVRFTVFRWLDGALHAGVPLSSQGSTSAWTPRITFLLKGEL